ncbi:MAG: hypothetical protein ACJ8GJ_16505 [Vitreoscilla sp.]
MSDEDLGRQGAIQLPAGKMSHFIGGPAPGAGQGGALERRKFIWTDACNRSAHLGNVALRLRGRFADPNHYATFSSPQQAFDTVISADAAAHMAVMTFLTIFNKGFAAPGLVSGNLEADAVAMRNAAVEKTFPSAAERNGFEGLLSRLRALRDGLIAHSDGSAQQFEEAEGAVSFRPDCRVSDQDLRQLLEVAAKLRAALMPLPVAD